MAFTYEAPASYFDFFLPETRARIDAFLDAGHRDEAGLPIVAVRTEYFHDPRDAEHVITSNFVHLYVRDDKGAISSTSPRSLEGEALSAYQEVLYAISMDDLHMQCAADVAVYSSEAVYERYLSGHFTAFTQFRTFGVRSLEYLPNWLGDADGRSILSGEARDQEACKVFFSLTFDEPASHHERLRTIGGLELARAAAEALLRMASEDMVEDIRIAEIDPQGITEA